MKKRILSLLTFLYLLPLQGYTIHSSRFSQAQQQGIPVKWSILICTLTERKALFDRLYKKLMHQITQLGLQDQIEILSFCDQRNYTIGFKRNMLLRAAQGEYLNFLDDDDDVSDCYIALIYERIMRSPDVVALRGILTFDGKNPHLFIHSLAYNSYFEKDGVYYRPFNHLNTMRSEFAKQCSFPEQPGLGNQGEDTDWALQLLRKGLLKKEESVDEPYYFYLCRSKKRH